MKVEIMSSGFGGQGALTIAKFLTKAAMKEGKHVTWLPAYGPEMRGGTANATAVISDEEIASPIIGQSDILFALNQPSLDKFGPSVRPGGLMIVNSDMCPNPLGRDDIEVVNIPLNTLAKEIGNTKVLNMIAIGVVIEKRQIIKFETIVSDLTKFLEKKNPALLELNIKAIRKGMEFVK